MQYILVHGAWHGSWCWHKVARRLQSRGHTVTTPDLPGHYLNLCAFKEVSLRKYVEHIEGIIHAISDPVVLVGHSMAGVVISQVAENMPDRIAQLVYVSGFIPQNGGSLMDEEKKAPIPTVALEVTVDQDEGAISLNSSRRIRELFYAKASEEDAAYALPLLQKQPLRPFREPVFLSSRFEATPKLYVECLQDQAIRIDDQRRMYSQVRCEAASLDTDHSPFFCADDQLVAVICGG